MKLLVHIALVLVAASILSEGMAQDIIYKKDGQKIEGKVVEVSSEYITFKKASNLEGPNYKLPASEILMITYENGTHEIINQDPVIVERKPRRFETEDSVEFTKSYGKNVVSMDFFQLIQSNFAFTYERIMLDGKLGAYAPIELGTGGTGALERQLIYNAGLGVNYYPLGQGRFRYFTGLEVIIGEYKIEECTWTTGVNQWGWFEEIATCGNALKAHVTAHFGNGFMYQVTKYLNLSAKVLIGPEISTNKNPTTSHIRLAANMSIRF